MNYQEYLPFCETPRQREVLECRIQHTSNRETAKALGRSSQSIDTIINRVRSNAEKRGYSPEHDLTHSTPASHVLNGASTLYDDKGNVRMQWVKSSPKVEQIKSILDAVEEYTYTPAPRVAKPTKKLESNLCNLYTITDFHLGMYSYAKETGDDWDTQIASKVMMNAIDEMCALSPGAELGVLNLQGDFLHWDGLEAVTPTSGHVLDADTRFRRMIDLSMDLTVWAIERLLKKHKNVHVIICEGNHDLAGSAWLQMFTKKMMAKNPRVSVDDTEFPFYAYQFGKCMLGFHHGHKKAIASLPEVFASEPRFREMWGSTECCYIHTGHYHHKDRFPSEYGGAVVTRHPTLAGRDAHAARGGYVSQRGALVITYHKNGRRLGEWEVAPNVH